MTEVNTSKNSLRRQSGLAHVINYGQFGNVTLNGPSLFIRERHPLTILQLDTNKSKTLTDISNLLNVEFPHATNTCNGDDERRILWLGPNRWLIVEPEHGCLQTLIKNEFRSSEVFLTDLSHGKSTVRLRGRKARDVLMKGSGVDWHLNSFGTDYCAHTKLFDLAATVDCRDIDAFDIYIARGFAEDFWDILLDSAEEFGYQVD